MKKYSVLLVLFFLAVCPFIAGAKSLELAAGTSTILTLPDVTNIEYEDDSVLSARVLSKSTVLVTGKRAGKSDVLFQTSNGDVPYSVNIISVVSGRNMIQMDAQILEVSENSGFNVGVDWNALLGRSSKSDSNPFVSPLNITESMSKDAAGDINTGLLYLRKFSRGQINVIVDFLVNGNHAKLLAKPKLISSSGKAAQFLSGGEIPVPVTDSDGKISVDWKNYGISLNMTPTLSKDNKYIQADIKVEVSNVDYSNAVSVGSGGSIPAMRTRRAQTSIDLAENETVVIAGLLSTQKSKVTSEVPVLSGIPFLGELFKNTSEKEVKTELVIFVTPRLITQ